MVDKHSLPFGQEDQSTAYTVTFSYEPKRTFSMEQQLLRVLREPPPLAVNEKLPYHLDSRHAKVLVDAKSGMTVLEVGCGGGQMRTWVQRLGHRYFGSDVCTTRVNDSLRTHGGPDFISDAHFLPFKERSVGLVYCTAVTEHLACPVMAFQNIFRVLRPGGYFLGNCSFLETWHDYSYFHMTPLGICELLSTTGFEIEYVWPEKGYTVFNGAVRLAFRGPFRIVPPMAAVFSGLYKLQAQIRILKHLITKKGGENPLIDKAKVAGAIAFIARKSPL